MRTGLTTLGINFPGVRKYSLGAGNIGKAVDPAHRLLDGTHYFLSY